MMEVKKRLHVITGEAQWFRNGPQVAFKCPRGHVQFLALDSVSPSGTVDDLIVCDAPACGFQDVIRLLDWTP